jgi:hypothetical protein
MAACNSEYEDVSDNVLYKHVVGSVCQVNYPLNAYGVALKLAKEKKTDLVVLSDVRASGPEITFSTFLSAGTLLEVLGVRQCTNCPFDARIEYRVRVTPAPEQFTEKPVYMTVAPMASGQLACKAVAGAA